MSRKLLAEFLGTYFLVFAGTGAIVINGVSGGKVGHVGIGLTFGLVVLALIYTLGDVSGAHINPAVTLGFWAARLFPRAHVLPYILTQCLGACLASLSLHLLFPLDETHLGATLPFGAEATSFLLEVFLTWFLMFVVLQVACGKEPDKRIFVGVAVGAVIALEAIFAGPICGASMNPARSLGPALVSGHLQSLWIYLLAPPLGALLGVGCWLALQEPAARSEE